MLSLCPVVLGHQHCGGIKALMSRSDATLKNDFIDKWMEIAATACERTRLDAGRLPFGAQCSYCEARAHSAPSAARRLTRVLSCPAARVGQRVAPKPAQLPVDQRRGRAQGAAAPRVVRRGATPPRHSRLTGAAGTTTWRRRRCRRGSCDTRCAFFVQRFRAEQVVRCIRAAHQSVSYIHSRLLDHGIRKA